MGTIKKSIIGDRLAFYTKVLTEFTELLSPQAFILFIIYFGEYLLAKFSKHKNATENNTGASVVLEVGKSYFYESLVNLRNAITHYDKDDLEDYITKLESIDYSDLCPVNSDDTITHCILVLSKVDWNLMRNYLL